MVPSDEGALTMTAYQFNLPEPTLILGVGVAGSGKSTVLKPLAARLVNGVFIEKDLLNESFMWVPKEGSRDDVSRYRVHKRVPREASGNSYYVEHVLFQSYHCMIMLARQHLQLGKHPILEGNYVKEIPLGYIESVLQPQLEDIGYRLKMILTYVPAEVVRQRLIARASERDRAKLETESAWQEHLKNQPIIPSGIEHYDHIKIDTTGLLDDSLFAEIETFLLR